MPDQALADQAINSALSSNYRSSPDFASELTERPALPSLWEPPDFAGGQFYFTRHFRDVETLLFSVPRRSIPVPHFQYRAELASSNGRSSIALWT